ncbi:hypothetical protein ACFLSU_02065 [Bacteroidota bacterium]
MKEESKTFIFSDVFKETLSLKQLNSATALYYNSFNSNPYAIPNMDTLEFMLSAKREKITFGPYKNLTFFEMSNRIYSDIVLLEAAQILFKTNKIKSVKLKMSNHSGNDIAVIDKSNNIIVGEAFNTANSYFQTKMRGELKKFNNNKKGIIAFNKTALVGNETFFENKKNQFKNITFIICEGDTIKI